MTAARRDARQNMRKTYKKKSRERKSTFLLLSTGTPFVYYCIACLSYFINGYFIFFVSIFILEVWSGQCYAMSSAMKTHPIKITYYTHKY